MNQLLRYGQRHPLLTLIFIMLVTLFFGWQSIHLKIEITAEGMMVQDDPERVFYEESLKTFGSENVTIIYFRDESLFTGEKLQKIRRAVDELTSSPLVQRIDSLFSVRYIRTVDGYTYTSPYLKEIPEKPEALKAIIDAAEKNPLIAKNLLSVADNTLAINVFFNTSEYHRGFDQQADLLLKQKVDSLKADFEQVFYIGDPYVRVGLTERIKEDQKIFIPLAVALLIVTLALTLRQPQTALIPMITSAVSIIWTLGLMAWLDIPLNIMTSVVPALLIIIGSTEDIHLISEFNSHYQKNGDVKKALGLMADNMGIAVILTFISTYLGFLSITAGSLQLLQDFGLVASTGLLFNFIVTLLLVPLLLRVVKVKRRDQQISKRLGIFESLACLGVKFATRYRLPTMIVIIAITMLGITQATRITVNNNVMDYFSESSELRRNADILHEHLSGIQTLSIVLSGEEADFLEIDNLQLIWNMQAFMRDSGYFDSTYSLSDFIAMVHSGLNDEWSNMTYLPEDSDVVEGYLSLIDADATRSFLNDDYSQTRIMVRHNMTSSEEVKIAVEQIKQFFAANGSADLQIHVTGESYLNGKASEYMAMGQFWSLILILSAIFLIVSLLFMNFKAGLIAATTSLFPIVILFGVMGFFDIPINTSTAMVAAISLGVSVDYIMHFMVRYNRLSRVEGNSIVYSLTESAREEAQPVISTAIALAFGFLSFAVSDFPPVARFGQLSSLVMLAAVVSTFVLAVLMLHHVKLITVWDVLSVNLKRQVLESSWLFKGLTRWQARKVMAMTNIQEYQRNDLMMIEGQPVNHFYILLEGRIQASRSRHDGSIVLLGFSQAGSVFGSLFPEDGKRCASDLMAVEPSKVLRLDWQDIHHISQYFPRISIKLYKNLSAIIANMMQLVEEKHQSFHDDPYGLISREVSTHMLKIMIDRARRYDEPLTVITLKILPISKQDKLNFSNLMLMMAKLISPVLRKPDIFSRWEEDMFMVVMPNTDRGSAMVLENRLFQVIDSSEDFNFSTADIAVHMATLRDDENLVAFIKRFESEALDFDWDDIDLQEND